MPVNRCHKGHRRGPPFQRLKLWTVYACRSTMQSRFGELRRDDARAGVQKPAYRRQISHNTGADTGYRGGRRRPRHTRRMRRQWRSLTESSWRSLLPVNRRHSRQQLLCESPLRASEKPAGDYHFLFIFPRHSIAASSFVIASIQAPHCYGSNYLP